VVLSNREFHVLQLRPWRMICHKCVAKLAAELPEEPETRGEARGTFRYGVGACAVCAQFSSVALFAPPDGPEKQEAV
jgi:hypothetical protein